MELSRPVAASFGRVGVVASLARALSGLGFVLLTGWGDVVIANHDNPPHDAGGSVPSPDSGVTHPPGTVTPEGAVRDAGAVDSGTTNPLHGGSSTDAGSDGPLIPPTGCAAVPVPVSSGRMLHVTTTDNDGNADGSTTRPYASLS